MQEIALILSSLAGVATAAAVRKMPRNKKQLLNIGASAHIKNQINSLKIEKDILTKTISRLYQSDSEYSKIQRDKLLLKYQHQLGIVLAKLEKLEAASHHPDLGPVGDGLITLMDQKLSKLDDRLYELSSKIQTKGDIHQKVETKSEQKQEDKVKQPVKEEIKPFKFDKPDVKSEPIVIPPTRSRQSFELTTLTRFSKKEPKFPFFEEKQPVKSKEEIVQETIQPKQKVDDKIEIIESATRSSPTTEIKVEQKPQVPLGPKPDLEKEVSKISEHKALPSPKEEQKQKSTIDDDLDDNNDDDLDKIKGDIMRVLNKLEQAEVE